MTDLCPLRSTYGECHLRYALRFTRFYAGSAVGKGGRRRRCSIATRILLLRARDLPTKSVGVGLSWAKAMNGCSTASGDEIDRAAMASPSLYPSVSCMAPYHVDVVPSPSPRPLPATQVCSKPAPASLSRGYLCEFVPREMGSRLQWYRVMCSHAGLCYFSATIPSPAGLLGCCHLPLVYQAGGDQRAAISATGVVVLDDLDFW